MDNQKIYGIGEKICAIDEKHSDSLGKCKDAYIGADNLIHFRSGRSQEINQDIKIDGYSVSGLADFIWIALRNYTPINERLLNQYDINSNYVKNVIMDALEDLGFYNHVGNRS